MNSLRRFVPRAPRYVLRPQDRNVMRFSLQSSVGAGGIENTILLNLSETGVAFLVNLGMEPRVGDSIKVEIPIPGEEQIAWWARVVRTSEFAPRGWLFTKDHFQTERKVLVALRFEKLPVAHTRRIRRGLNKSFMQAMREQQFRNWFYYRGYLMENYARAALAIVMLAGAIGLIWWLAQPGANYDAKRGAPWGERFKF